MEKASQWTTRLLHENQMHTQSSFVTLTFNDQYLPEDYSVNSRDLNLFMKRLRKALGHNRVRFFACGEYGDQNGRPHYHLLLFGYDFPDRTPWRRAPSGEVLYRSELLERVWPFGHAEIGAVTEQSIQYVARYILKKINGDAADEHYSRIHPLTGEYLRVRPEFITMSRRPGIGAGWFDKFARDAFPSDFVVIDGKRRPVPRYYLEKEKAKPQAEDFTPEHREGNVFRVGVQRARKSHKQKENNTPERRATREASLNLKVSRFKRDLDGSS